MSWNALSSWPYSSSNLGDSSTNMVLKSQATTPGIELQNVINLQSPFNHKRKTKYISKGIKYERCNK